jgi:hypothetical protein
MIPAEIHNRRFVVAPGHICKECGSDKICVLCGRTIRYEDGCNPEPLAYTGRCCGSCDIEKVIPARGGLRGEAAAEFARKYRESMKAAEARNRIEAQSRRNSERYAEKKGKKK